MKAFSLWQPWASLVACGAKPFETRDYAPPRSMIGQPFAVHAAKKIDKGAAIFAEELMYGQHVTGGFALADQLSASFKGAPDDLMGLFGQAIMPIGCVVGIVKLVAAFQLGELNEGMTELGAKVVRRMTNSLADGGRTSVPCDDFGDYAPGRWAWLLADAKPLRPPVAMKGKQGWFDLPQGWLTS